MGLREIPTPKDPQPEDVSDDEIAPGDDETGEHQMSTGERIRLRKMRGAIKKNNELRAKRRKEADIERAKLDRVVQDRNKVKKEILEALDYENLNDLDDAMKLAARLGLEGKNNLRGDKAGAWRCRELKEAYRLRPGIESKKRFQDRIRAVRAKKDREATAEREIRHEEWSKKDEKTRRWRVSADLIGKDRQCNRYWVFSWHPDVVYVELVGSNGITSTSPSWNFYTRDQIIELHASLDYRGKR